MAQKIKKILIIIAVLLAATLIGYVVGRSHPRDIEQIVKIDTLVRYDTIKIDKPVEVRYVQTTKTIRVPVRDTIRLKDTTYVVLPKETKEYRDSQYYAKVSGYQPSLDYIEVYPKTTTVTKTETIVQSRSPLYYSLDLQLDYGSIGYKYLQPSVGAELGYKKWAIEAAAGLNVEIENNTVVNPNFCWKFGLKYNILGK